MCKKLNVFVICLCLTGLQTSIAQEANAKPQKAFRISKPSKVESVPPLATRIFSLEKPDLTKVSEVKDGRSSMHQALIGKGSKGDDVLANNPHKLKATITAKKPELVFETGASNFTPTDPTAAVGTNHYFATFNKGFQIFDKSGKSLTGGILAPTPAIFPTDGCCDITISYDNNADLWVLSMLKKNGAGVQVAVSDGPDPINDGWTVYSYNEISDYQKLSIWRDGYYMTDNDKSNPDKIHVFERSAMIDDASAGTAIPSNETAQFTFATKADFSTVGKTYSITAAATHGSDEDNTNDQRTQQLTHKHPNDIGVSAILKPFNKQVLGADEPITVVVKNYGTASQSNFDVSYSINGGTPVVEQLSGPLATGSWLKHTFATKGDFSGTAETYIIDAETSLTSDAEATNNNSQVTLKTVSCLTETNTVPQLLGPDSGAVTKSDIYVQTDMPINDVNVTVNIAHSWANDLDVKLIGPNWRTEVVLLNDVGGGDDDFINTVLDDDANTAIENGSAPFTGTFKPQGRLYDFVDAGLSSKGNWRFYIEDDQHGDGGNLISWSIEFCNKKTLFVEENNLEGAFNISNNGNNQFEITLTATALSEDLDLYVYDTLGQNLLWDTVRNEHGTYRYILNMSHASSGVYIVRLGDNAACATKRIIVK